MTEVVVCPSEYTEETMVHMIYTLVMASFLPHVNHVEICKFESAQQLDYLVVQFIFGPIARDNNVS